jgi:hypothetical protein
MLSSARIMALRERCMTRELRSKPRGSRRKQRESRSLECYFFPAHHELGQLQQRESRSKPFRSRFPRCKSQAMTPVTHAMQLAEHCKRFARFRMLVRAIRMHSHIDAYCKSHDPQVDLPPHKRTLAMSSGWSPDAATRRDSAFVHPRHAARSRCSSSDVPLFRECAASEVAIAGS